ncbi:hypothetical protein CVV38_01150 [Candidatus Peregrinibacteria bacterium HGW-Peregrinibacteria-1]|jgi:O-antigen/teichoic acid export membrane protein|nr:MAG: hypothetical protein CVV38_01150 [Candidatus Peregrinibacteria bacterium HGW-Peregrinibacteria-1]
MSLTSKIFSNTVYQLLSKVVIAILGILVVKITTNYLGVAGYGQYTLVYEFLAFFGIAADLGLFTIAVKEMSEDEDNIPKIIGNILSLRAILVTLSMLAAIVAIFLIPQYTDSLIPLGVTIASITVFITIINGTITSVLQTKLQMGLASIASIMGKIVSVAFMAYIVFYGFPEDTETGFLMLIVAGIIGAFATLLITNHYVRKITPLKFRFDLSLWKQVIKKSLPYGLALILSTVYFRIDSIMISLMRGEAELGIYGVAMKMLEQIAIIPLYFMNSVLPVLTKSIKEGTQRYQSIISRSFDFLTAISLPMVVGGFVLAYPIIFIVADHNFLSRLSEGFYGSDIALQIIIFALIFQFLNVLCAFILIALDKQTKLLYINAACVLINLVSNFIVIPKYGFVGAAFTTVMSEIFIFIATFSVARHYLKFKINIRNVIAIAISAIVMGIAIKYLQPITYQFIQNWNILLLIPMGGLIYLIMLFLTRAVDLKTVKSLIR